MGIKRLDFNNKIIFQGVELLVIKILQEIMIDIVRMTIHKIELTIQKKLLIYQNKKKL